MLGFIKNLLGGSDTNFGDLVKQGAVIIDVRTKGEYAGGHISSSINIPLDLLGSNLGKLKSDKPIITCCASGMRSASAKNFLKSKGFAHVYNGGSWSSLKYKIQ